VNNVKTIISLICKLLNINLLFIQLLCCLIVAWLELLQDFCLLISLSSIYVSVFLNVDKSYISNLPILCEFCENDLKICWMEMPRCSKNAYKKLICIKSLDVQQKTEV